MRLVIPIALVAVLALACGGDSDRRLLTHPLRSEILDRRMPFSVLMPPACPPEARRELHVVYLLHGYGGDNRSLDEEGLSDRLFVAQAEGRLPHLFIVAPRGERGFYMNWHDGSARYEDYLIEEVIPAAEEALELHIPRERRHLAGVSMGGHGALLLALKHPDLFESASSISGSLFDRGKAVELAGKRFLDWAMDIRRMLGDGEDEAFLDANNPYSLVERVPAEARPRIFLAVGSDEPESLRLATTRFHDFLSRTGVEHAWAPFAGGHNWESWAPVIEEALLHAVPGALGD